MIDFSALRCGPITLHLIEASNADAVRALYAGHSDSEEMITELNKSYLPRYDQDGRRTKWGFYTTLYGELAGMSLLGIDDWSTLCGYTGADTFLHMRGRGVAPGSKPGLFHLGFHLLGLERIETGCDLDNFASKRSIEKTPGFVYEGIKEDNHYYAISRADWERLYDPADVELVR